ncbi:hypothetical protein [Niabella ginsengisoli]|uniref:Tail assembly chaperone n=1 Tax=Niabella ginsengisoli TaxID=522298 RepID=A0ABS9SFX9_9BACT|nr:hypothetical protein [Niabella ginsengisoli]MCH5597260.1 hypothetical protein [Niabella ginsengisoli]
MRIDNLNDLPDWDDDKFGNEEEGEEWKPNPTRDACKALYQKWKEVMMMLNGLLENDKPEKGDEVSYLASVKQMVLGDAYEVAAKIRSSEAGGLYVLRMENAAIIRKNAQYVASALLTLGFEDSIDEKYVTLLRTEIDQFKALFKVWVNSFEKDEYTDDWGLFV